MKMTMTAPRVSSKRLFTRSQSPITMKLYTIRIFVAMITYCRSPSITLENAARKIDCAKKLTLMWLKFCSSILS